MIFAKRNVYNQSLDSVAAHVFVYDLHEQNETDLELKDFLSGISNEVDQQDDKFNILLAKQYVPLVEQSKPSKQEKFCLIVDAMEQQAGTIEIANILSSYVEDLSKFNTLPQDVDMLIVSSETLLKEAEIIPSLLKKYRIVATEVSNYIDFKALQEMGIQYFEGDFIEKPERVTQTSIPANKLSILKLISMLSKEDVELNEITQLIAADNILSYKLLRIVNSPIFRGMQELESIQEAIVRFGFSNLKKWVLMLSLCNVSDKPAALIKIALTRAILCSLLAKSSAEIDPDMAYTVGLLSTLDAFIDAPIKQLLEATALAAHIQKAILYHEGKLGELLSKVIAYQRGELGEAKEIELPGYYLKSLEQANQVLSVLSA